MISAKHLKAIDMIFRIKRHISRLVFVVMLLAILQSILLETIDEK